MELDEEAGTSVYPLSELLATADLPLAGLVDADALAPFVDGLYYTEAASYVNGDSLFLDIELAFPGELTLTPPGLEVVTLAIGTQAGGWTRVNAQLVIGPDASLRLLNVPISLRVREDVLRDVATSGPAQVTFFATLGISSAGLELETPDRLDLPLSEVAGSGLRVALRGLAWNLRSGESLDLAAVAGIEGEFIGFGCEQADLQLSDVLPGAPDLHLANCLIGTGGFSGTVAADYENPPLTLDIGGFQLDVAHVAIGFRESRLVLGELHATLRNLPFFDTDLAVRLELTPNGVRVQLLAPGGSLFQLRKEGLIRMSVASAQLEIGAAGAAVVLSGSIALEIAGPGGMQLPGFEVQALRIGSDGSVSLDGGLINLPQGTGVNLGGFGLELTQVGLGTEPSGERFAAFSGALHLLEGLPLTAAVDGLKIIWDNGGHVRVEFAGIALSFEVEGALRFDGMVHFDDATGRFDGAGRVELIALRLTVDARILISKQGEFTALYVYLLLQAPVGIPLFATGLAFYGFEALYGQHVEPDKSPPERWYRDWYRRPQIGAVDSRKWVVHRGSYAFGAGVILGTLPDGGFALSTKGLLLLVVPGPILMLDIKANLLRDPTALTRPDAAATFNALVVYDGRAGSIEIGIEPHYAFPGGGELIEIGGVAEAFYSFSDPRSWHLYLGRREREKRIRAGLLKIFEANAYLMLDATGLELGAFVGYDARFDAGPAYLIIQAFMEAMAGVSWRPMQLRGAMQMSGKIELKVLGIGFGLGLRALLEAEAPHPFHLLAELAIEIGLPWPLPDIELAIALEWSDPKPPRVVSPLQSVAMDHTLTGATWALLSGEERVVPRDARLALLFERGMSIAAGGAVGIQLDEPPAAEPLSTGKYLLRASVSGVELEIQRDGAWVTYVHTNAAGESVVPHGVWQEQSGDKANSNRRLIVDARTPFDWERQLSGGTLTQLALADETSPCDPYVRIRRITFDDVAETEYAPGSVFQHGDVDWVLDFAGANVISRAHFLLRSAQTEIVTTDRTDLPYRGLQVVVPQQFGLFAGQPVPPPNTLTVLPTTSFHLRLDLHDDMLGVSVLALATSEWSLEAFNAAGTRIERVTWSRPASLQPGVYVPAELAIPRTRIRFLEITVGGDAARTSGLLIMQLVVKIPPLGPDRDRYREQTQELVEAFHSGAPVFEPDGHYRLRVTVTVEDANSAPRSLEDAVLEMTEDTQATQQQHQVRFAREFLFRTLGPPGRNAFDAPLDAPAEGRPNFDTLDAYVAWCIPASGPALHYRSYDVAVQFKVDYLAHLYESDGRNLQIALIDQAGNSAVLANRCGPGREVQLREHEQEWLELVGNGCVVVLPQNELMRATEVRAVGSAPLEPRARYELLLRADPPTPGEAATPLFKTTFIASRFEDFRDHFRVPGGLARPLSLGATPWADWTAALAETLGRTGGDPWLVAGVEREARNLTEVAAFDAMFGRITNVERELSAEVRLASVVHSAASWAMLLESPEPWPWERIELRCTVVRARSRNPFDLLDIAVTMVRDADGVPRFANASVEVAFQADTDLRGYSLEVEAADAPRGARSYRVKQLGAGATFAAGERVSIDLEAKPRRTVSPWRRFVVALLEAFGVRGPGLADLRLRDPEGRVVVNLPAATAQPPESLPIRAIRDFDGTRALLIPVTANGPAVFPRGSYTLEGVFKRASIAPLPAMTEAGDDSDETARLRWALT